MANFKALGIEKEINEIFLDTKKSELTLLNESSFFESPYIHRRQEGSHYCEIEIVDCQSENWWYRNLIGLRFFCRIVYVNYGRGNEIVEFMAVKITKTKEIIFRSIKACDAIII